MKFYYKDQPIDSKMTEELGKFFGFNYYNRANNVFHNKILERSTIDQNLTNAWDKQYVLVYDCNEFTVLAQLKKPVIPENNQWPDCVYYELSASDVKAAFKKHFKTLCVYHRRLEWSISAAVIIACAIGIGSFIFCVHLNHNTIPFMALFMLGTMILCLLFDSLVKLIAQPYIDEAQLDWDRCLKKAVGSAQPKFTLKPVVNKVIQTEKTFVKHEHVNQKNMLKI